MDDTVTPPVIVDIYYDYRPLFDLFGKSEGTDKGDGYNETLGYGAYTGGDVNLTAMTLREVDALQTRMLKHPANKWNSSAVGRYQIVRTTLRKIKKALQLTDDMKFDQKLQDHMCLHLLEGRGLSKYLTGKLSEDAFMTNLAKEWASIPTPNGTGYYSNQKKTPVTPNQVRTVLAEVKRRIKG
ncbi:hypothetical protein H7H48_15835 [Nitratireductor sp. B36]|uniref:hypothetical protein n=1 Tax=Nitratireductor sp. B36 TaxID=2762059 RepID=UPI001E4741BA|nr:hypothetical protein [Nitratireductor sp. B36]MCC5780532.1 hypothetical protein [Nitratireductor sp. B36]